MVNGKIMFFLIAPSLKLSISEFSDFVQMSAFYPDFVRLQTNLCHFIET